MTDHLIPPILTALTTQLLPLPSRAWLSALLSSRSNPPPPLASLVATARARLLAADISSSPSSSSSPSILDEGYIATHCLPRGGFGGGGGGGGGAAPPQEARLQNDVLLQVLDIENVARSRWEQAEELEAIARGEQTRGREIIRVRDADDDDDGGGGGTNERGDTQNSTAPPSAPSGAPQNQKAAHHRLTLQDARGTRVSALELRRVERVGIGRTMIGEKWLVRKGAVVARGSILLEPGNVVVLGGKVEGWQKGWVEGRLGRLKEGLGAPEGGVGR